MALTTLSPGHTHTRGQLTGRQRRPPLTGYRRPAQQVAAHLRRATTTPYGTPARPHRGRERRGERYGRRYEARQQTMLGFRRLLNRVLVLRRPLTVEAAVADGAQPPLPFDATDARLAPDRQRMLAQFWKLRAYAIDPDSCRNPSRVISEFNSLRNQYGYSPVDLHLKVQYFCGAGLHDRVVDCLRESKSGPIGDLSTYNMVLESLSKDARRYHQQCRSILTQMVARGIGTDHRSFAAVLAGHLDADDVSRSITLLALMFQRNMFPSSDQLDRVLGICCERNLAEEVIWLLECALYSPYSIGADAAVRIVRTFKAEAPSEFLARRLSQLRLQNAPDVLDALEEAFQTNSDVVQLLKACSTKSEPESHAAVIDGRAPGLPSRLQRLHTRPSTEYKSGATTRPPSRRSSRSISKGDRPETPGFSGLELIRTSFP